MLQSTLMGTVKIYEPESQTLCSIKSQLLIPNVYLHTFLNTKSRPLGRKCPICRIRSACNNANASVSDVNQNSTPSEIVTFIQSVYSTNSVQKHIMSYDTDVMVVTACIE